MQTNQLKKLHFRNIGGIGGVLVAVKKYSAQKQLKGGKDLFGLYFHITIHP